LKYLEYPALQGFIDRVDMSIFLEDLRLLFLHRLVFWLLAIPEGQGLRLDLDFAIVIFIINKK